MADSALPARTGRASRRWAEAVQADRRPGTGPLTAPGHADACLDPSGFRADAGLGRTGLFGARHRALGPALRPGARLGHHLLRWLLGPAQQGCQLALGPTRGGLDSLRLGFSGSGRLLLRSRLVRFGEEII